MYAQCSLCSLLSSRGCGLGWAGRSRSVKLYLTYLFVMFLHACLYIVDYFVWWVCVVLMFLFDVSIIYILFVYLLLIISVFSMCCFIYIFLLMLYDCMCVFDFWCVPKGFEQLLAFIRTRKSLSICCFCPSTLGGELRNV